MTVEYTQSASAISSGCTITSGEIPTGGKNPKKFMSKSFPTLSRLRRAKSGRFKELAQAGASFARWYSLSSERCELIMTELESSKTYAKKITEAVDQGSLSAELQKSSEAIRGASTPEAADKMLQEVTSELHSRGAIPKVVGAWARENFSDLDLDGNGKISAAELDSILKNKLLSNATNPLERQLLRFMQVNRDAIAKAKNDEWGGDTSITAADLTEYEKKSAEADSTAVSAKKLVDTFGDRASFNRIDANRDGFLSEQEVKDAQAGKRGSFNDEERQLLNFMRDNRTPIAKSVNDQRLFETRISLADINAFARNNKVAELPTSLASAKDYSERKVNIAPKSGMHLPDLVLDFGKEHFAALDHNGDGKINRAEVQKLSSPFWRRGMSEDNMRAMSALDNKLEYIQRSHRDEYWYKDRKGVTTKDLEAYAKFEAQNRKDLPTTPGDHKLQLTIGGVTRDYTIHVPKGYDGSKPVPIVYAFHYFTGNSDEMAATTRLSEKADKEGFVVVYPDAKGWLGNKFRQWNLNNNANYRVDEVAFVDTMMNTIEAKMNIDKDRVYVAGYSNGGMLAQEIAAKFSDRVAAMACVGGCQNGKEKPPENAVSTLLVHGRKDRIVPDMGRLFTPLFPRFKPLEHSRDFWRSANGTDTAQREEPAFGVTRETYTNSRTGKQVIVYRHDEGHCYPGDPRETLDGKPCLAIDATELMWDFFAKNKRTAAKPADTPTPARR